MQVYISLTGELVLLFELRRVWTNAQKEKRNLTFCLALYLKLLKGTIPHNGLLFLMHTKLHLNSESKITVVVLAGRLEDIK